MLTIKQCQEYLKKYNLSDEEVEKIRNTLYCISENIINDYIKKEGEKEKLENVK